MPIGASEIPDLKLVRLQKFIESLKTPPSLVFLNLFGSFNADSDEIKWEAQTGTRGMTPLVAPTAPAPQLAPLGISEHSAYAAFWKEKMFMSEQWLNNLREPGTVATYEGAKRKLAREISRMRNRSDRRREWLCAKMLTDGSFTYKRPGSLKVSVDYSIPTANLITLGATRMWDTGSAKNIAEDIFDTKLTLQNNGISIDRSMCPTEVLKLMLFDTTIQNLLKKSAFGDGDFFKNPAVVLADLLGFGTLTVYDEQYILTAWLTAAVTGSSTTTIYLDEVTDIEVGDTIRFHDTSAKTYEDETVSAVDVEAGTVTISTAPTASFKASEDKITITKKFLNTNKFLMFASSVEGEPIAEFMDAPFGLDRHYGMKVDQKEEWDPEALWVRTQNKGLPVLYNPDAVACLTVKD
jgi:hypothetical protein